MNIFKKLFGRKKTQEPEFVVEIPEEIIEEVVEEVIEQPPQEVVVEETDPVIKEYLKALDECEDESIREYYKEKIRKIRARG